MLSGGSVLIQNYIINPGVWSRSERPGPAQTFFKSAGQKEVGESIRENALNSLNSKNSRSPAGRIAEMEMRMSSRDLSLDASVSEDGDSTHMDNLTMTGGSGGGTDPEGGAGTVQRTLAGSCRLNEKRLHHP